MKLGYKNTKYLTRIVFMPERNGGYWSDQGYEWYARHLSTLIDRRRAGCDTRDTDDRPNVRQLPGQPSSSARAAWARSTWPSTRCIGRQAAVKVLLPELARGYRAGRQRFFNEARAANAIRHPGIVEVFDFGHAADGGGRTS